MSEDPLLRHRPVLTPKDVPPGVGLESIFENIGVAFFALDNEWRFTYVNSKASEIFGRAGGPPINLIGKVVWEEFPEAVGSVAEECFRQSRVAQCITEYETFYAPLNTWIAARVYPTKEGIAVYFHDISARKHTSEAERISLERLKTIFNGTEDYLGLLSVDGTLLEANSASLQWGPCLLADVIGKPFWKTIWFQFTPDASVFVEKAVHRAAAGDYVRWQSPINSSSGETMVFDISLSPVRNEKNEVVFIIPEGRDITARSRAEDAQRLVAETLLRAKEQADAASRAKDSFLAALSHELRTPLTPVLLTVTALSEESRIPPDLREQLKMIERNVALEARLIDDLLDVTAISSGKLHLRTQLCDSHSLISLAIDIVRADANAKSITLARAFKAERSGLITDPARFQQVIWNLLRNAVKFTPEGGSIYIETREELGPDGSPWLRVEVTDSGIGIDPTMLERIFLPFEQGHAPGTTHPGGLGLGLSIARAVVNLHHGKISASSEGLTRGATFTVELPAARAPELGAFDTTPPFPSTVNPSRKLRVLLVEDHFNTLQALTRLLDKDGHAVVPVQTVEAALTVASEQPFDVVISDLGLSDGNGNELMAQLREAHGLRGIALTGFGMEEDISRTRAAGFLTHLIKPVSTADLRRAIAAF